MRIRWRSTVVLLFVIAAFGARLALAGCRSGDELTILHFNDFHGQLEPYRDPDSQTLRGGLARLTEVVRRIRAEDSGRPVLLLFAGDLLQGTLTSTLFLGVPDALMFDRMGVDAAVMGNHEFDYGLDVFRRLAGQVGFPFLAANVRVSPEPLPTRGSIVLDEKGVKVAVVGLVTPELLTATHPRNTVGVIVEDPVAVARRLVPELRDRADLVVVLSHLGLAQDRRLADSVQGIDLIVGGHNHHVLQQPVVQSGVPILQAGERGEWIGRMDLVCRDGAMHQAAYRLIPIDASLPEDPEMAREIARIVDQAEADLGEEIGETKVDLSARREDIRRGEAVFGDFLADLARSETGSDVAFFNAGGFRADIPRGRISLKQIYQTFPFRNELVVGRLSGRQILDALGHSASMDPEDNPGGFLQVSGVRYEIVGRGLGAVSIAGRPIDPDRLYSVVTSDFLAEGGDGYAVFKTMVEPVMTGRLISDMLVQAIRERGVIAPHLDGRIRRVEDQPLL
ncbi:bifunctional metallophosphatase/5'-nucleotidase [Thiorhodococcus fuscus]|uniref:Bifunctional metallophosphatase/5'-nucleotidase n=1 Tax=Thiorhodococcus fuscus TaxID=527200 RepID=A0ABW4Y490_9GAMM